MTKLVWTFLALLAGVLAGLGMTASAVDEPPNFGVIEAGAWITRPKIGTAEADPYSKALLAARGEIPMGAAEGIELTATVDGQGQRLSGACTYRFDGPVPAARYWTLTAYRPDGALTGTDSKRSSFTSIEVVRDHLGQAVIRLSPEPQGGNWIPLPGAGPIELALRLYDTQISGAARALDAASVPKLTREACR